MRSRRSRSASWAPDPRPHLVDALQDVLGLEALFGESGGSFAHRLEIDQRRGSVADGPVARRALEQGVPGARVLGPDRRVDPVERRCEELDRLSVAPLPGGHATEVEEGQRAVWMGARLEELARALEPRAGLAQIAALEGQDA
jgi:hypothetical protein